MTIGSPRPREAAAFWARLTGWQVRTADGPGPDEPPEAGWAQVGPPPGEPGMTLNLEYERCFTRPVWPAEPGQPVATQHLDVHVTDLEAAVAWALACGATLAEHQPQEDVRVMLDPDGHPFCLFL